MRGGQSLWGVEGAVARGKRESSPMQKQGEGPQSQVWADGGVEGSGPEVIPTRWLRPASTYDVP